MPTSTVPYEVLFELANNTPDPATMQVLRQDNGSRTGATILMHRGENISLVLTAGSPYKYAVKQRGKGANLSVKLWQDTQCNVSDIFDALASTSNDTASLVLTEGVALTSPVNSRSSLDG
ncbi:hypothetical protein AcW1_000759 [Taiwanofungus camphoratus]|nr:hypothetical protein AcW1_000759 [Antrodia cinnamomea]